MAPKSQNIKAIVELFGAEHFSILYHEDNADNDLGTQVVIALPAIPLIPNDYWRTSFIVDLRFSKSGSKSQESL